MVGVRYTCPHTDTHTHTNAPTHTLSLSLSLSLTGCSHVLVAPSFSKAAAMGETHFLPAVISLIALCMRTEFLLPLTLNPNPKP